MNTPSPELPGESKELSPAAIRSAVMKGGAWITLGRWSIRTIGICSTIVLARLLAPEDFGLVAICLLLVGMAETIGRGGQNLAVIRNQNLDREYMDSAWTASVLTGFALGAVVLALAPVLAGFFNEPRAILMIEIMSVRVFLMGFENIGIALFAKDFEFSMGFKFEILEKVIPVGSTIILAYFLRNYWALVFGAIAGHFGTIAASYLIHNYRPRFCFKKIREVWAFSGWIILEKFAFFGTMRIDRFFIPAFGTSKEVGYYHVGTDLARMPTFELFMPLTRVLFPAYAKLVSQPKELANAYINTLSVAVIICLPASIGFTLIASDAVRLIYGEKWIPMIPIVEVISLASGIAALIGTVTPILQVLGKSRMSASIVYLQAMLLLAALLIFQSRLSSTSDIAMARLLTTAAILPIAFVSVQSMVSVRYVELLQACWRPVFSVIMMTIVLLYVLPQDMELHIAVRLGLRAAAGALVFAGTLMLLWLAAGKPPGAERALMRFLENQIRVKTA